MTDWISQPTESRLIPKPISELVVSNLSYYNAHWSFRSLRLRPDSTRDVHGDNRASALPIRPPKTAPARAAAHPDTQTIHVQPARHLRRHRRPVLCKLPNYRDPSLAPKQSRPAHLQRLWFVPFLKTPHPHPIFFAFRICFRLPAYSLAPAYYQVSTLNRAVNSVQCLLVTYLNLLRFQLSTRLHKRSSLNHENLLLLICHLPPPPPLPLHPPPLPRRLLCLLKSTHPAHR